jgi:hypothetical protein
MKARWLNNEWVREYTEYPNRWAADAALRARKVDSIWPKETTTERK